MAFLQSVSRSNLHASLLRNPKMQDTRDMIYEFLTDVLRVVLVVSLSSTVYGVLERLRDQ